MQLDLFVQLDTHLSSYYAIKEAKANHELLEATLRFQMIERREKSETDAPASCVPEPENAAE